MKTRIAVAAAGLLAITTSANAKPNKPTAKKTENASGYCANIEDKNEAVCGNTEAACKTNSEQAKKYGGKGFVWVPNKKAPKAPTECDGP